MASRSSRRSSAERCNAGFDDRPDEYDVLRSSGHMARRRAEHFAAVVAAVPGTVLEIGCGTGTLLHGLATRFPDRRFVGVEPLPGYVDFARERASADRLENLRFEVGTAESLGSAVDDGSVGLLVSVDALHHVTDLEATVREAARAVGPGGRWHAMEPNRLHPYVWIYHTVTDGERTFPVAPFLRTAQRAGWRLGSRGSRFLVPSGVRQLPPWAERLERRAEHLRPLAGAVVLDLVRRPA